VKVIASKSIGLRTLLRRASREYESRKDLAESNAVRREYFSGPAYDLRPYFFERFDLKRGRKLTHPRARAFEYGFDKAGRLILARQPSTPQEPSYEEFWAYRGASAESAAYFLNKHHSIHYVTRARFSKGLIVACDVLDANGQADFAERYSYRRGRLHRIGGFFKEGREAEDYRLEIAYDRDGVFQAIRQYYGGWAGNSVPIYWNPARAPSLEKLWKAIEKWLLVSIPAAVHRARIKDQAYCLAIAYDNENHALPPFIGIGLDKERQSWLATKGRDARGLIWNPAEYSRYEDGTLDFSEAEWNDTCQRFCQFALSKGYTWCERKLLNQVAARLNKLAWRRILPVTEDFIVYAVDLEGADFKRNLKDGVPAGKLKQLRRQKLI
jgi:hypothetical protein